VKEIIQITGNLYYTAEDNGKQEPIYEIVIITCETKYKLSNESILIRKRGVKEFRGFIREKTLEKIAGQLLTLPENLKKEKKE